MKSATLPSFWDAYFTLNSQTKKSAKKAYKLWSENSFHPSLHFKFINDAENIWSVRITLNYRAIGVLADYTVTWFWIGSHDEYEKYFG
jgi:hypothetical protein